jgi:hypothetical protein
MDKIESDKLLSIKIKDKNLIEINDNEITYSEQNMNLQSIIASAIIKKEKSISFIENPNIGVIDLETYLDNSTQKARVDSAGLYSNQNKKPITFYIDKTKKVWITVKLFMTYLRKCLRTNIKVLNGIAIILENLILFL